MFWDWIVTLHCVYSCELRASRYALKIKISLNDSLNSWDRHHDRKVIRIVKRKPVQSIVSSHYYPRFLGDQAITILVFD